MRLPGCIRNKTYSQKFGTVTLRFLLLFVLGTIAVAQRERGPLEWQVYFLMGLAVLTNFSLFFEPPERFTKFRMPVWIFLLDFGILSGFIYYLGHGAYNFYIALVVVVLLAAVTRSMSAAFLISLSVAALYFIMTRRGNGLGELFSLEFELRLSLMLATAMFVGYLAQEAHRERIGRVQAERDAAEEVASMSKYVHQVLQMMPGGVVALDPAGRVTVFNHRAEEIIGLNAGDVLSRPFEDIPGIREIVRACRTAADESGEISPPEAGLVLPDGRHVRVRMNSSRLADADGLDRGQVCVFQDITKAREYETRMAHQERIATVGRLASEIAHEFNNQLGGVKGHLEFALKTTQSEPVRDSLQVSVKTLEKSLGLVRNLLGFSRRPEPKRAMCPLGEVVHEAVVLLGADLTARKIEVIERIDDTLAVMCDRMQMHQVLVNLMINARDAMPSVGKLAVALSREGESVKMTVSDTGCGIPEENLEKVFEPFFTTKGGTDASGPVGTGLGLSVAKNIVEAHGGSIRIESKVGAGTTVVVKLPV